MSIASLVFVSAAGLLLLKGASLLIVEFADLRNSSAFTIGFLSLTSGRSVRAISAGINDSSEEDDYDVLEPLNPANLCLDDSMYLHPRTVADRYQAVDDYYRSLDD